MECGSYAHQKYHSRIQGEADQGPAKSLSVPNVGLRRDPESLSAEEKPALEALFEKIPC